VQSHTHDRQAAEEYTLILMRRAWKKQARFVFPAPYHLFVR
jgi:hypothetical protein